jgi:hypothetical protein
VVRLCSTGVILEVELQDPLDISRACLLCATKPVDATVRLGPWENGMHRRCSVWVAWPSPRPGQGGWGMPDPKRFMRRRPNPHQERAPVLDAPPAKRQKADTGGGGGE